MVAEQAGRGPTRRQQAAVRTRQRILAAARALFAKHGFEAVTTEQIAEAAGVAKGTLFLHARTKDRLLVMVYEEGLGEVLRRAVARPPTGGSVASALTAVFRRFFRVYEEDPALARRFIAHLLLVGNQDAPAMRALQDESMGGLAALIQERKRRGQVAADVDVALAAGNSFLLYFGVLVAWLGGWLPDPSSRDALLAASLSLHWRGLEGEPRRAGRARRSP